VSNCTCTSATCGAACATAAAGSLTARPPTAGVQGHGPSRTPTPLLNDALSLCASSPTPT
jgi:hypothetical protein